ncbi:hypothetical protein SAICODRAFT_63031 [Saitoella complicata NRRL Y-17804]|nr:uncharacterized protein SAICODRAFT_63031 [Saitoella complicata NRRL Y-17804]ODQ49605.1 hypothetical protein SAICODRAFT_63031 [Saitoella complicata NRRL Y-17804]
MIALAGLIIFIVLGVSLGVGLGVGLPEHASHTSTVTTSSASSSSDVSGSGLQSWQRDTATEYTLDFTSWNTTSTPQIRTYNLTLTMLSPSNSSSDSQPAPDGGPARPMLLINGEYPGPLIRANLNDTLQITVNNQIADWPISMHWHGQYQNSTPWFDGTTGITQCPIPPNASLTYDFTVGRPGTFWYHAHTSSLYIDGLVGPLVVHDGVEGEARGEGTEYDYEQVVLLSDWYHRWSTDLVASYLVPDNENVEPIPDAGLINGKGLFNCSSDVFLSALDSGSVSACISTSQRMGYPLLTLNEGRTRLRLINVGAFADFWVGMDNHPLTVIEADGTDVEPLIVDRVPIAVGERYSVVVDTTGEAAGFWFRAEMNVNCFGDVNEVLDPNILAAVRVLPASASSMESTVGSTPVNWIAETTTGLPTTDAWAGTWTGPTCRDLDLSQLVPAVVEQAPVASRLLTIDVSFQIGANAVDLGYMNSTAWVPTAYTPTLSAFAGNGTNQTSVDADEEGWIVGMDEVGWNANKQGQWVIPISDGPPDEGREIEVIDLVINNLDDGSHPFHLHGHQFYILAQGPGALQQDPTYYTSLTANHTLLSNPMRRDTVTVESYGHALIRWVADNPGVWAFHCHIAWHVAAGLMVQFVERGGLLGEWDVPDEVAQLCDAGGWRPEVEIGG